MIRWRFVDVCSGLFCNMSCVGGPHGRPGLAVCTFVGTLNEPLTCGPLLQMHKLQEQLPHARMYNGYGPTETSVWCTAWDCVLSAQTVTIGKPKMGSRIYILGPKLEILDIGVDGEIVIGG